MKRLLLLIVVLMCAHAHGAGWTVKVETDSMTDRQRKVASTKNAAGHSLSVYGMPDGSAWVNFSLPSTNTEVLASSKWPMYRVDKYPPRDLDDERRLARLVRDLQKRTLLEPKWINFQVWDGNSSSGRSAQLVELSEGNLVTFRYYLFTGGYAEATFDLAGAGPAISDALALSEKLESGSLQRTEAMEAAIRTARKECEQNAVREDFSVCFDRARSCAAKAESDVRRFHACQRP